MEKLKMHSPDKIQENVDRLSELFPGCVTEARNEQTGELERVVDIDFFRQMLAGRVVEGHRERYRLEWPGKKDALLAASAPIAKSLRPQRSESVNFDVAPNLFIEGDNLDALKLLQESYLGRIKIVYIDPPYNTGGDLIYEDDFAESASDYLLRSSQVDADGTRLVVNSESNGRFHSDWLSMIYSRLRLARNLMRSDGVLFVSIGNDEFANLKKICDEIFGERCFVECLTWNKRVPKNDKGIGNIHEYVLVYARDSSHSHQFTMPKDGLEELDELLARLRRSAQPLAESEAAVRALYKKQGYDRGITLYNSLDNDYRLWGKINMSWPNGDTFGPRYEVLHPGTGRPVKIPDRGWRWKQSTFDEAALRKEGKYSHVEQLHDGSYRCGRIWFAATDDQQPSSVTYLDEVNRLLLRSVLSLKSDGGLEVEGLLGGKTYFSYPKPTSLLRTLLGSVPAEDGDIVLDFFAGSGTTAHAVMQLNAEDSVSRRFIAVQLPEPCDPNSDAANSGLKTLADVAKARLRRAAEVVQHSYPKAASRPTGFRSFRIDSSNMSDVFYSPEVLTQGHLPLGADNIKSDRSPEDLLFQVLVDWGVDLALPIETRNVAGRPVFFVDQNALVACFEFGVDEPLVRELATLRPLRAVFRDGGYVSDSTKINVEQIFKLLSPATEVRSL